MTLPYSTTLPAILGAGLMLACTIGDAASAADYGGPRPVTVHRHHRFAPPYQPAQPAGIGGPVIIPLDNTGAFFQTPFYDVAVPGGPDELVRLPHYQKPDGSYDGLYGLSSSIQGYPCGQECTNRSLVDWGYAPAY